MLQQKCCIRLLALLRMSANMIGCLNMNDCVQKCLGCIFIGGTRLDICTESHFSIFSKELSCGTRGMKMLAFGSILE